MADIRNSRLLYVKGALFLLVGALSAVGLLLEYASCRHALLLGLTVWGFARAYYFAFYVVEHYVDGQYKFAGLGSFLRYLARGGRMQIASRPDQAEAP